MNRYNRFIGYWLWHSGCPPARWEDSPPPQPDFFFPFFFSLFTLTALTITRNALMNNDFKGGGSKSFLLSPTICYHHPFEMFFAFKIRGTARKTDISYPHPPSCHRIKGKYGRKII